MPARSRKPEKEAPPTDLRKVEIPRRTWNQWRHARAQSKMWDERAAKMRALLEAAIGDNDAGTINDVPVIIWKPTTKPRKFNLDKFKKAHPDLYEEFREFTDAPRPFNEAEFDPELLEDDDDA